MTFISSGWKHMWAATCDFQPCGILTSVDSYEPVEPPFKLWSSKWYSVSSLTLLEYSRDKQKLWSDCMYAQAYLRLWWSCIQIVGNLMPRLIYLECSSFSNQYDIYFIRWSEIHIWAATCDFQPCGILTSVDSDEPVQPPFQLRNSKWCSVVSLIFIE